MDLYTLDGLLRRTEIIDVYESLIWTERYKAYGDFELHIRSDRGIRALFPVGTRLAINKSRRIMTVETVEKTTSLDGVAMLKIVGPSLEETLRSRGNRPSSISTGVTPLAASATGTPGAIVRSMFDTVCRSNTTTPSDNLPFLHAGVLLPAGSIPEPAGSVTLTYETGTLYESIKNVCDVYDLGFRLIRNGDTSELYFEIYTGNDRTTLQSANSAVVFSPELDNLSGTAELTSSALYKNVAYVFGQNGSKIVYRLGADANTSGFDRRVLVVKADDITLATGAPLQAALEQRGQEELAKNGIVIAFDGEVPQFGSYIYQKDYDLGDLVETRNSDGLATNMRVDEQIFTSDATGERSYPTLVSKLLITPGSWNAWNAGQYWDDALGYWHDSL
jgi:hypothetical protein